MKNVFSAILKSEIHSPINACLSMNGGATIHLLGREMSLARVTTSSSSVVVDHPKNTVAFFKKWRSLLNPSGHVTPAPSNLA